MPLWVIFHNRSFKSVEIAQAVDDALDFYNDERMRSLEGDRFDFDELITELNCGVFEVCANVSAGTVDPDV